MVDVSVTAGHQGGRASADISTSGLVKPSTTEEDCLAGDGNQPQEGLDETTLIENHLVSPPPADDPQIWDFTLDGTEEPNGDGGSPLLRGRGPGSPRSHSMQTRSQTPQRGQGRPSDAAAGQERGPSRTHPPNQHHHIKGEDTSSDFRDQNKYFTLFV